VERMEAKQRRQRLAFNRAGAGDQPQQPVTRQEKKVGRNDPCPCGSGLKYKKCCGS
jgi:preprotein translocase subunit SecA